MARPTKNKTNGKQKSDDAVDVSKAGGFTKRTFGLIVIGKVIDSLIQDRG